MDHSLEQLIQRLGKLPGLGKRSARRAVLHLITHKDEALIPLIDSLNHMAETVKVCSNCGNVDTIDPCAICQHSGRDQTVICVVESIGDIWAIERSNTFTGTYHVLGGTLSAIDGIGPDDLNIESLLTRAGNGIVAEVVLANNATIDGQTTAHYIVERLDSFPNVKTSRIAHGIPIGGELDYLDDGTLGAAFAARTEMVS